MSDLVARLGAMPAVRRLVRRLQLPLPLPFPLRRSDSAWEQRPLDDCAIAVGAAPGGTLAPVIARTLVAAGASPQVVGLGTTVDATPFRDLGEAYGRPPAAVDAGAPLTGQRTRALVFDATGIEDPAGLAALHGFFHPLLASLEVSGRVVVLGRPADRAVSPLQAAARAALDGFNRSLAKEVGRRGATAKLVWSHDGAEARVEPVLRFLLSPRSAFVSGAADHDRLARAGAGETPFVRAARRQGRARHRRGARHRRSDRALPRAPRARAWCVSTGRPTTRARARSRRDSAARCWLSM